MSDKIQKDNTEAENGYVSESHQIGLVKSLVGAVNAGDHKVATKLVENLHSADLADVFELLSINDRKELTHLLRDTLDPDILSELEGRAFDDVISVLDSDEIAEAITSLDTDDAVYVLEEMGGGKQQQEVLDNIAVDDRAHIEKAFSYPEDSAGRLMQRDFIAVPSYWNVGQTIDFLRTEDGLNKDFWEVFVVDPQYHPVGTMPLSWLLRSPPALEMSKAMMVEQTLIPVAMDQEEVAFRFRQYNLVSAAVVDDAGRLVGMITIDDIVDVMEEEAEEDILALAGVREGDVNISIFEIARTRFAWLAVNLGTAIIASVVIAQFGASIEKLVALAILMPIVASMGGNAGTQTMAVTVRALASKEITSANAYRIVSKEFFVSILNGVVFALIMGIFAGLWFASQQLGLVIAAAMVINMVVAGLSGILIPLGLDRLSIDPAVSSSVFVTTITDVIGFLAFLGLAAIYLV